MKAYKVIVFDADGTLTPQRAGSCGEFSFSLLPGVGEMCKKLVEEGVELAIASNQSARRAIESIQDQMLWTAEQLSINNDLVLWASGKNKKPNKAMIISVMNATGCDPEDMLFVGDQPTDKQAAEAAGVEFIWAHSFFSDV